MIFLIFILIFNSTISYVNAANQNTFYAKILFDEVYLYKSPVENNDCSNIYFELPKTYFVELISQHENFYQARYLNFTGYVKKDSVQAVSNTPINPFLNNITFRVYAELSQHMQTSPTDINSENIITKIPYLSNNITYLGKINGESLIQGRTNVWYFCKYTSDQDYYGYVYSDFCDEMTSIQANTEDVTFITNPTFEKAPENKTIPITNNAVSIIIGILSIPALIFIFLIIKGTRILNKEKYKSKEVVDY